MRTKEVFPSEVFDGMPTPGTIPHLDWLFYLESREDFHGLQPAEFLRQTAAPTTIARQVMRHRSHWPLGDVKFTNSIFFDCNFLNLGEGWEPGRLFSARIDLYGLHGGKTNQELPMPDWEFKDFSDPVRRSHNLLTLSGRPYPNSNVHKDIIYSFSIPLTPALLHDDSRSIRAYFEETGPKALPGELFGRAERGTNSLVFDESINTSNYDNNTEAFFKAFRAGISDLHLLVHHQFKNRNALTFDAKEPEHRISYLGRIASAVRRAA